MSKAFILFIMLIVSHPTLGVENEKEWIDFNTFVEIYNNNEASQQTLIKLLNNPNLEEVEFGIRYSMSHRDKINALPVYDAIWQSDEKAFPSIDIEYLRQPVILLAVASAIAKGEKCIYGEQYKYVINHITSEDGNIQRFAIVALGHVGTNRDLGILIKLLKEKDETYTPPIALSILEIDPIKGAEILDQLQNEFGQNSNKSKQINSLLEYHDPNNEGNIDDCDKNSSKH